MVRLAVIPALLVLLLPGSAQAAPGERAGMTTAQRVWGTPPCGTPHVEVSTPAAYQAAHGTGYFAAEPDAWADEQRCAIVINPTWKIRTAVKRCHIILHEWGHLKGYEHSDDYKDVMYADLSVVGESVLRDGKKRRWTAVGAFKPCYSAVKRYG